jgi:SAM-dependent methyltransferase
MKWRGSQAASRNRYLAKYDEAEAEQYESWVGHLTPEDEDAYLSDLNHVFSFRDGMAVLDAGAGTGTFCMLLSRIAGLSITALEPAPAMLAILKNKAGLKGVATVEGFCDSNDDRCCFNQGQFDVIVSRQLGNGLFDPLTAFSNWHYWLSAEGSVVLIDGLYDRSAWTGKWEEEIDILPLSACQTTALTPYLLEAAGFRIDAVERMEATNKMPATRTTRYVVVATKIACVSS